MRKKIKFDIINATYNTNNTFIIMINRKSFINGISSLASLASIGSLNSLFGANNANNANLNN